MKRTVDLFRIPDSEYALGGGSVLSLPDYVVFRNNRQQIEAAAMDLVFKNYYLFGKPALNNTRKFVEYLSKTIHELEQQDKIMALMGFDAMHIPVRTSKPYH
jgi:hypothetical protein